MTFTYTKQVSPSMYSAETDEEFFDEDDFEYEVADEDIEPVLAKLIFDEYFNYADFEFNKEAEKIIKKSIMRMFRNHEIFDQLAEDYEYELKKHFESEAMLSWE